MSEAKESGKSDEAVNPRNEARTFESTALDLAKAMESAIKRFETIQETHPDIILDDDLAYYRSALFWFHRMPAPSAREAIWGYNNG